jgi:hypothetical protein
MWALSCFAIVNSDFLCQTTKSKLNVSLILREVAGQTWLSLCSLYPWPSDFSAHVVAALMTGDSSRVACRCQLGWWWGGVNLSNYAAKD